jgi:hypothetical protein
VAARWVLTNANGYTRTVMNRSIEQPAARAAQGPPGPPGTTAPRGPRGPAGPKPKVTCTLEHHKIKCKLTFPKCKHTKGTLRMSISRGKRVAARPPGRATITMRERRQLTPGGKWTVTIVLARTDKAPARRS